MEVKDLIREKTFAEILVERGSMVLDLNQQVNTLKQQLEQVDQLNSQLQTELEQSKAATTDRDQQIASLQQQLLDAAMKHAELQSKLEQIQSAE